MANWIHEHSQTPSVLVDFINEHKPKPDGIICMSSNNVDFHVWVRKGDNFPKTWKATVTSEFNTDTIASLINGGKSVILGPNMNSKVWYFEHE